MGYAESNRAFAILLSWKSVVRHIIKYCSLLKHSILLGFGIRNERSEVVEGWGRYLAKSGISMDEFQLSHTRREAGSESHGS
jgi:hypothetical protein